MHKHTEEQKKELEDNIVRDIKELRDESPDVVIKLGDIVRRSASYSTLTFPAYARHYDKALQRLRSLVRIRLAFDLAWKALQPRVKEVLTMPGVDEAGVEGALLRIAAYLHIRNGQDASSFQRVAMQHFLIMEKEVEES